ncbi:unnamed protein product [Blepharisma stoltei]|uniref:Uncharacterized protein n=1 Tax=Blepharisma stoltei TaxID=1481888 RepID=A0AAU9K162_9CILI|nr:unnamed protein product [Blepharisma stoltei]
MGLNTKKISPLLEFTAKAVEFIFQAKAIGFKKDPFAKSPAKSESNDLQPIRDQVYSIFSENSDYQELIIEILETCEDCNTQLIELWRFISTAKKNHNKIKKSDSELELATNLRVLMAGSLLLPSSYKDKSRLRVNIRKPSVKPTLWNSNLSQDEILRFPEQGLMVTGENSILTVYVEYIERDIKPELIVQNLGNRIRAFSFDIEDTKYMADSLDWSPSSGKKGKTKMLSLIDSESFYEDNESGIKLISSVYDSNSESSESEKNEFANNSFEMNFGSDGLEEDPDLLVSNYLNKCDKAGKTPLFIGHDTALIEAAALVKKWRQTHVK